MKLVYEIEIKGVKQEIQSGQDLRKVYDLLRDTIEQTNDPKLLEGLNKQFKAVGQSIRKLERDEVRSLQKQLVAGAQEGADSYRALQAQLSALTDQYRNLSKAERDGDIGASLLENINALDTELKELDANMGQYQRNVGNYASAWSALPAEFDGVVSGVGKVNNSFKLLLANPLVAVLTLAVAALGALTAAFSKSERGAVLLEKGSALVSLAFGKLIKLSDDLFTAIGSVFSENEEAVSSFGEFLATEIIGRFEGLVSSVFSFGGAIANLLKGDFEAFREGAKDFASDIDQVVNGLDSADESKVVGFLKNTTEAINESVKPTLDLAAARRAVAAANRELAVQVAELAAEEQRLQGIAGDGTLSFKEQAEANEAALEISEKRAAAEIAIARNNLNLLNQEVAIRRQNNEDIQGLLEQQSQALAAVASAEGELTNTVRANAQERRQIKQDELERDLDIVLDGFENQSRINQDIIADERRTVEERRKVQQETEALAEGAFTRQIEILQQFTDIGINANELLNESDSVRLNEQIRSLGLSEIIEGRLLEIIRDKRDSIADLQKANEELAQSEREANEAAIEGQRDTDITAAINTDDIEAREQARTRIELEAQKKIIEEKLKNETLFANEEAALRLELADTINEIETNRINTALQNATTAIELEKNAKLQALAEEEAAQVASGNQTTEQARQIAARKEQIEREAQARIIQARLESEQLSALEREDLELELLELRVMAHASAQDRIDARTQQSLEIVSESLTGLNGLLGQLGELSSNQSDARINDLEREFERRIELAQGNAAEQERLQEELAERRRELQIEEFEREKRLQKIQASIAFAQGLINAVSQAGGNPITTAIRTAFLSAIYFAQLASINAQQFTGERGLILDQLKTIRGNFQYAERGKILPIRSGKIQGGLSHKQGGNHHGNLEYERGEYAEFIGGKLVVINKKSSKKFKKPLLAMAGKNFEGKIGLLSQMNAYNGWGDPFFAENGGVIPMPNLPVRESVSIGNVAANMSSEQMMMFAQVVANQVSKGAGSAIYNGMNEAELQKERRRRIEGKVA